MTYLVKEDYLSSANLQFGISKDKEDQMVTECISFIQKMAMDFNIRPRVCGTALTIFHIYAKKFPFTEFDRYMVSTLCLFLAAKIDYNAMRYFDLIEYYYKNKKGPKGRQRPFDEVKDKLKEAFVDQEFKILITLRFELDFDLPFEYIDIFRE